LTPKTKEQNEAIKSQTRAAIMQAALELFAQKGFASTSISAIAKHAGISKGLMYNYFESKQKLLEAIIFGALDTGNEVMQTILNPELSGKVRLKNLIEMTLTMISSNFEYWKLMASLSFQADALNGFDEVLKQKTDGHIQLATQLFKEIGFTNPRMEAMLFGAILDGIVTHMVHMSDYPLDDMKQYLFEKYEL